MIPASIAGVLLVMYLIITVLIAVVVGFVLSRALRRQWGARDIGVDAALAAVVAVVAALVVASIDFARGTPQSREMLVADIAIASVVIRHLVQSAARIGRRQ